jgi:hypothetical protein
MRRYIVLLLITGILWAQTNFDTLILKSGTTYFGEYSKIEEEIVYFKPQNVFAFQPVPVELIQTLKLKDGHFIIGDGKSILTFEEYQKVNHLIISNKGNKGELIFFCSIITVFFIVIIWKFDGGFSMSGFDLSGHETAW